MLRLIALTTDEESSQLSSGHFHCSLRPPRRWRYHGQCRGRQGRAFLLSQLALPLFLAQALLLRRRFEGLSGPLSQLLRHGGSALAHHARKAEANAAAPLLSLPLLVSPPERPFSRRRGRR